MFYQLPPVGNRVYLHNQQNYETELRQVFHPYMPKFYQTGTAALAVSVQTAIRYKDVTQAEVILPAYSCPDLISAVVYAGARPVLVDLEMDRPWLDLEQVAAKITGNTVAVIAASLCGIPERLDELQRITELNDILLIADNAQLFPGSNVDAVWKGDLVVLSFGRGKPVSLLGGGAVLYREGGVGDLLPEVPITRTGALNRLRYNAQVQIYNRLISPHYYWVLALLPFLHIGETRYHALEAVESIDSVRRDSLGMNVSRYMFFADDRLSKQSQLLDLSSDDRIINLPAVCNVPAQHPLLRYPLLIEPCLRDQLLDRLSKAGMGASVMYPGTLPSIPGIDVLAGNQGEFPAAERFAGCLLTLPVHAGVRDADIREMAAVFQAACP